MGQQFCISVLPGAIHIVNINKGGQAKAKSIRIYSNYTPQVEQILQDVEIVPTDVEEDSFRYHPHYHVFAVALVMF